MKVRLAYGTTGLTIDVPDDRTSVVTAADAPALADPAVALRDALRNPIGTPPLRGVVRRGQQVAVSVCDGTRAQPRALVLEAILDEIDGVVRPEDVTVLIATGTHRGNTPAELAEMLGTSVPSACRVRNHDARDDATLVDLGRMGAGVPVRLARAWLEADVRITTGLVEPHFFAGFSGGPKMVAPGLAGLDTVLTLHDAARIGHPRATWGVVEGNPVQDDVREIARRTGVHFTVETILNRQHALAGVFAGELFAAHAAACAAVRRTTMRAVPRRFPVVVTSNAGWPLDQNLYQCVKGMSAAAEVVEPGGTIVCAAECRDGLPDHGAYARLLAARDSPSALLAMIEAPGHRVPDQWQVQIQARIQQRARVVMKAGRLAADRLRAAHLVPTDDVTAAVADALAAAGAGARLCVLPDGPRVVPYVG
jgi:nickel-dependent lactate racemase